MEKEINEMIRAIVSCPEAKKQMDKFLAIENCPHTPLEIIKFVYAAYFKKENENENVIA